MKTWFLTLALAAAAHAASWAQTPAPAQAPTQTPAPRPADVATPEALTAALMDVISGPAGQARDWDRFRSLFAPGARLAATSTRPDGSVGRAVMTPEDYVRLNGPRMLASGFQERELAKRITRFGNIAHVWHTYEAQLGGTPPQTIRGINSIQLWFDGARWWVTDIQWQPEQPNLPLPQAFLGE